MTGELTVWQEMAAAEMAPGNRFEWFEQVVSDVLLPTEFRAADPGGFRARGGDGGGMSR